MPCTNPEFHQKSFRIKHDDDKFLSKLLSKETSKSNPSFRVYYGDVSSAVPFTWETRPGTPKHVSCEISHIPPLTPPPSFYTSNFTNSSKKSSRSRLLLHSLLRRVNPKKARLAAFSHSSSSSLSSPSWSSSSLSSFSDPVSTPACVWKRRRFSSWGSSFDERAVVDDRRDQACASRVYFHGGCSAFIVKKALLSIVGRRGSAA